MKKEELKVASTKWVNQGGYFSNEAWSKIVLSEVTRKTILMQFVCTKEFLGADRKHIVNYDRCREADIQTNYETTFIGDVGHLTIEEHGNVLPVEEKLRFMNELTLSKKVNRKIRNNIIYAIGTMIEERLGETTISQKMDTFLDLEQIKWAEEQLRNQQTPTFDGNHYIGVTSGCFEDMGVFERPEKYTKKPLVGELGRISKSRIISGVGKGNIPKLNRAYWFGKDPIIAGVAYWPDIRLRWLDVQRAAAGPGKTIEVPLDYARRTKTYGGTDSIGQLAWIGLFGIERYWRGDPLNQIVKFT